MKIDYKATSAVLFILLLIAVIYFNSNKNGQAHDDAKITNKSDSVPELDETTFVNKQQCFEYRNAMEEKLNSQKEDSLNHNNQRVVLHYANLKIDYYINEVFYSKEKNSCLAAYTWTWKWDEYETGEDILKTDTTYYIDDVLSGENYYTQGTTSSNNSYENTLVKEEFQNKLKQLKAY